MLEKKDIENLIEAMKEVFPTAEMINKSFNDIEKRMATKDQIQEVNGRLDVIEEKLEGLEGISARIKTVEDATGIE